MSTTSNLNPNAMLNTNNLTLGHSHLDDLGSIKQQLQQQQQQQQPTDVQSVDSYTSDNPDSGTIAKSPDKRSSLMSLPKVSPHLLPSTTSNSNTSSCPNVATCSQDLESNNDISTKKSFSNSTLRHSSANRNSAYNDNKRPLRTTVSKIFDSNLNGAPLRRYSGVPDHVNLEDYIEQSNNYSTIPNSVKKDEFYSNRNNKFPHGLNFYNDHNTIEEEHNGELANQNRPQHHHNLQHEFIPEDNESDENDIHSMFYYNHKNDLETKPQISDYGEDEDADDYDRQNATYNSYYGSEANTHELPLHGRMPSRSNNDYYDFMANNNTGNNNQVNEYTPLRTKRIQRHLSRANNSMMNGSIHMNVNDDIAHSNIINNDNVGYSPHNFYSRKSPFVKLKNFLYFAFVISSLLMTGFILGFLLATNKELQDVDVVVMDNVISSSDELIFDITVSAFNPGFFSISVSQVDLDIFAKSSFLKCDPNGDCTIVEQEQKILQITTNPSQVDESFKTDISGENIETVLLGTVKTLETPLKFQGGAFNRNYDVSVSSIKLLDPGSSEAKHDNDDDDDDDDDNDGSGGGGGHDDDGNDGESGGDSTQERQYKRKTNVRDDKEDDTKKWKLLIKHDYELIVRGSMKYEVPFFNTQKSTAIQKNSMVHPGKK